MEGNVNMAKYFVLFVSLLVLGISIGSNLLFLKYKSQETRDSYEHRRKNFMEQEGLMRTGGDLKLNSKEEALNSKLMAMKLKEIQAYRDDGDGHNFPPAVNFLKSKPNIEKSEVFKFIRTMPKGNLITLNQSTAQSADKYPAGTWPNDDVNMTSKQRRFDVIMTLQLWRVCAG